MYPQPYPRPWGYREKTQQLHLRSHSLIGECMHVCSVISVVSNSLRPMDCSPPGFSIHGILQARTLKWVAIAFSIMNKYMAINWITWKKWTDS